VRPARDISDLQEILRLNDSNLGHVFSGNRRARSDRVDGFGLVVLVVGGVGGCGRGCGVVVDGPGWVDSHWGSDGSVLVDGPAGGIGSVGGRVRAEQ
jgi:hypothetical protein